MNNLINKLDQIDIDEIIKKYCDNNIEIYPQGDYLSLNPCPKCGHYDCCKINTSNNTVACWSECGIRYLPPHRILFWLQGIAYDEAILKLATDFKIPVPENFKEEYQGYLKRARQNELLTRFAEECHARLSPEDYSYWKEQRGFTEETIKENLIGICHGDGSIYKALREKGFTEEEIDDSNMFIGENEYFSKIHNGSIISYYTLPNIYKGRVIDIQGRIYEKHELEHGLYKYKNSIGKVKHPFNPEAMQNDIVFLAEGIPDTLSLIQMGFNAAGSYGVGGVKDEWINSFKEKKAVYIVFDSDEPGQKNAYTLARKIGEHAKIVILPAEIKDVNEFLVKHGNEKGREIFEELAKAAKTALEIDIDSLPSQLEQVDDDTIKDISIRILDLPPHSQDYYRQRFAEHCGKSRRLIEQTVQHFKGDWKKHKEEQPNERIISQEVRMDADPKFTRLSQCFAHDKVFYAQNFIADVRTDKSTYSKFVLKIISSERNLIDPPTSVSGDPCELVSWKIDGKELLLRRPLKNAGMRWSKTGSPFSIDLFLEGREEKVSTADLYNRVEALFRRYYYTDEEYDYVILSLFTIFTYYYDLYDAVPYLFLNGPPESGKTTLCILLQHIAFNADLVSNISTSSLFREAELKQLTLILDEQESISNNRSNEDKGDYLSILKDAYKRTGTVKRQAASDYERTEEFEVFNPLVIANVKGLERIIKTRAIQITTRSAPKKVEIQPLRPSDPEFVQEARLIRDMIYCWVMQNHKEIAELPKLKTGDFINNRIAELFNPLFALASYVEYLGEQATSKLLEQLFKSLPSKLLKRSSYNSSDPVELLREACLLELESKGVTQSGESAWLSFFEIFDRLVEVNGQYCSYMTPQWIGEKIANSGWIQSRADKKRRITSTLRRNETNNLPLRDAEAVEIRTQHYLLRYELLER